MYRDTEYRGKYVRLDGIYPEPPQLLEANSLATEVHESLTWNLDSVQLDAPSSHVNIQELKQIARVVEDAANVSLLPARKVNWTDSQVSMGV